LKKQIEEKEFLKSLPYPEKNQMDLMKETWQVNRSLVKFTVEKKKEKLE
jgi:hypothetical protein